MVSLRSRWKEPDNQIAQPWLDPPHLSGEDHRFLMVSNLGGYPGVLEESTPYKATMSLAGTYPGYLTDIPLLNP